jgi:hypothetical protein
MTVANPRFSFELPLWNVQPEVTLILRGLTVRGTIAMSPSQLQRIQELDSRMEERRGSLRSGSIFAAQADASGEPDAPMVICDVAADELRFSLDPPVHPPTHEESRDRHQPTAWASGLRVCDDKGRRYIGYGRSRRLSCAITREGLISVGLGARIQEGASELRIRWDPDDWDPWRPRRRPTVTIDLLEGTAVHHGDGG